MLTSTFVGGFACCNAFILEFCLGSCL